MASLGNDLAKIRKKRELSVKDVQGITKIPIHIIDSIEDNSIFSGFEENPTYIRSYVRSYAKALGIDEKNIIYALDKQEKGAYAGSLQELLDEPERRTFELDQEADSSFDDESDANREDKMVHDHSPEFRSDEIDDSAEDKNQKKERTPPPATPSQDTPDVSSVDWADMGRRFQPLQSTNSRIWMGAFVLVLIIIIAGFIYYLYPGHSEPENVQNKTPKETEAVNDSLKLNVLPSGNEDSVNLRANSDSTDKSSQALTALPDTLTILVYAAYGKLEPVRIYTDIMNGINPYWIEPGNAIPFKFVNDFRLRGQYSRIVLMMNGHVINNFREKFYNPDTRRVEINRTFFEQDSKWLQPAPDSLGIDAPEPDSILKRPSYK